MAANEGWRHSERLWINKHHGWRASKPSRTAARISGRDSERVWKAANRRFCAHLRRLTAGNSACPVANTLSHDEAFRRRLKGAAGDGERGIVSATLPRRLRREFGLSPSRPSDLVDGQNVSNIRAASRDEFAFSLPSPGRCPPVAWVVQT